MGTGLSEYYQDIIIDIIIDYYRLDFDTNEDGFVSKDEFTNNLKNDPNIADDSIDPFTTFDENKDGKLSNDEFNSVMKESTPSLDIGSELKSIIKLIDGNGDDILSYDELSINHQYFTDKFVKFSKEDEDN